MTSHLPELPTSHVREVACDGGGGGHDGAHQMSAPASALPAFKVAIAGRGAALARFERVWIHPQTHGAASLAPFKSGLAENSIETFGFGLALDALRAGHDHRMH